MMMMMMKKKLTIVMMFKHPSHQHLIIPHHLQSLDSSVQAIPWNAAVDSCQTEN